MDKKKKTPKQHLRPILRWTLTVVGFLFVIIGVFVIVGGKVAPEFTEKYVQGVKVQVQKHVNKATKNITELFSSEEVVPITLKVEGSGGKRELDTAKGYFVELVDYNKVADVPVVYAQHNSLGGDVILTLNIGDKVNVVGLGDLDGQYVFEKELKTSKKIKVSELTPLNNYIVFQTCFYGEDSMRFIGLSPIYNTYTSPKKTDKDNTDMEVIF